MDLLESSIRASIAGKARSKSKDRDTADSFDNIAASEEESD